MAETDYAMPGESGLSGRTAARLRRLLLPHLIFYTGLLIALLSQHFFIKLVLAAPASGLPSLPTAFTAQDCAIAEPTAKEAIRAASKMRFMSSSRLNGV